MLRYIPLHLLSDAWPLVLPDLLKVQQHSAEPDLPEQILPALERNAAWLFVDFSPNYRGFVVLRPEELGSGRRNLRVWAAYSEKADFQECHREIEAIAREFGAASISFPSSRKGWLRRLKGFNFRPIYTIYKKVLNAELGPMASEDTP